MKAADFSNWQRTPTQADTDALHDLGITRVIIGSSFGNHWQDQVQVCLDAGFEVQNYCFTQHVTWSQPYWIDVEREENHVTTKDEVRSICSSATPPIGIYSSSSMWAALMGTWDIVAEFPWLRLWDANYGPIPRTFIPYGGWTEAAMTQYHDTMDIGTGFEVDLSYYEEEGMTPEEKAAFALMQQQIKDLQGYAWRDALRINDLEAHKHAVINGSTGTPQ